MILTAIAPGVWIHQSECLLSNTVIVQGRDGVLLVDPGLTTDELATIASDVNGLGQTVVAGFSTHPDWDHVLWHPDLGDASRYGTAECAAVAAELLAQPDWEAQVAEGLPPEIAADVPLHLLGLVTGLPAGATTVPWEGPVARIIQHRGHALGHAALLLDDGSVLVAGDMLSDVLVPMLGIHNGTSADPIADYLEALRMFDAIADRVTTAIPGHGTPAVGGEVRARIARDRAYVEALRDGRVPDDPRLSDPLPGWEWVQFVHDHQASWAAAR